MSFLRVLRVAFHSLMRTQGLALIVILTLALGIGANAAIFTLVRGVLLKPLVNRDEDRLIYIRQSAPGAGDDNSTFSVPEIHDLRASVKTLSAFGEFSTIEFTMIGLGEPRVVQAGVVDGPFFEVMGLHPVLGRLVGRQDDGPKAAVGQEPRAAQALEGLDVGPFITGGVERADSVRAGLAAIETERPAGLVIRSAKPSGLAAGPWVIALPPSSAFWNPPSPIPKIRKSSPTSSPARITFPPPWSPTGSTV